MRDKHNIQIDLQGCVGCGMCQKDCPTSNILLKDKKAIILEQSCIMCGHCVAVCPKAAVLITGFTEQPLEIDTPTTLQPETLIKAIKTRRSIRQFSSRPVMPETIARIIEAGRLTPTGSNSQDVSYIVLKDKIDYFEKIAVSFFRRMLPLAKLFSSSAKRITIDDHFFFKKAPLVITVISKNSVDGALAASNMALMAEAEGLGVLYSGFFAAAINCSRSLRKQLNLSHKKKAVIALVLGYSEVKYHRTVQKETADVYNF